jgi:hypothetical protein
MGEERVSGLEALETGAVSRALSEVTDEKDMPCEVFFERLEDVDYVGDSGGPAVQVRRESGLAARLSRGDRTWLASRDAIDGRSLIEALRQVARTQPKGLLGEPTLTVEPWAAPPLVEDLRAHHAAIEEAIRSRHAGFPLRLTVRRRTRHLIVVGRQLASAVQRERFYTLHAETPWGAQGSLEVALSPDGAQRFAEDLVGSFRSRAARPPEAGRTQVVLSPQVTAVFLHEAVAHALEVDTLRRSGKPESAIGLKLGADAWSVIDDPANAPPEVRRDCDDEGLPVRRRWLLRNGVVEEPLADASAASRSEVLSPGAGRRASRHESPVPRSFHLELVEGEASFGELLAGAEGGIFLRRAARGYLDPASGRFSLQIVDARWIRDGAPADSLGAFTVSGSIADILSGEVVVGSVAEPCGAGWCAKDGQRMPVWARCPAVRIGSLQVGSV